jgi:hypothetical protein
MSSNNGTFENECFVGISSSFLAKIDGDTTCSGEPVSSDFKHHGRELLREPSSNERLALSGFVSEEQTA